jgi:SAM-dependent methyltransferase
MSRAKNYFAWQKRLVEKELGRRVLEIGCGLGNFTEQLLDRDMVVALDIEPDCVANLLARFPGRDNLHAFARDINHPGVAADLRRFRLDSCVCLNVLEHIEDDRAALTAMAAALEPGGAIVLIVPAFQALYGPIDHNLGHYRRYDRSSVKRLAKEVGLRVRTLHYMNLIGCIGWWVNAHILKREAQSDSQVEVFDRYLAPAIARAEGWVKPWFGQSLFVVLERHEGVDSNPDLQ